MLTSGKRGAAPPTKEDKKAEDQVRTNYRAMIKHGEGNWQIPCSRVFHKETTTKLNSGSSAILS
jgi:hypothetical protein